MRIAPHRLLPALVAALMLLSASAPAAVAKEIENPWARWRNEVLDRPTKAEIPLAVLTSIPAMIVITPIWLGQLAYERWTGDE